MSLLHLPLCFVFVFCGNLAFNINPYSFIQLFHDAQNLISDRINDCFLSLPQFFSIVLFSECNKTYFFFCL
jgi:hypothetical protein